MRIARSLPALALTAFALPRPAEACDPDPCQYTETWVQFELVNAQNVGTDGVLMFDAQRGPDASQFSDAEALEVVSVEVLAEGQPLAGALELEEGWAGVVWRPEAPLPAGAELSIALTIDNAQLEGDICQEQPDPGPFLRTVSEGATPSLDPSELIFEADSSFRMDETEALDGLICCDGAYPILEDLCGPYLNWAEGHCEFTHGTGKVRGNWSANFFAVDAELRELLSWRVVTSEDVVYAAPPRVDGINRTFGGPVCARVELLNRVTGELSVELDSCLGEAFADQVGPQELDPSEGLAASCMGTPYVCEIVDGPGGPRWNADDCEDWGDAAGDGDGDGDGDSGAEGGDGDGDTDTSGESDTDSTGESGSDAGLESEGGEGGGCSCSSNDDPAPAGLTLALLALLGLGRRRARDTPLLTRR